MPFVLNFENARKGDELTSQRSGLRFRAELSEWDIKEFLTQLFHSHTPSYKKVTYRQFRVATQKCLTSLPPEPNATRIMERRKLEEISSMEDWIGFWVKIMFPHFFYKFSIFNFIISRNSSY